MVSPLLFFAILNLVIGIRDPALVDVLIMFNIVNFVEGHGPTPWDCDGISWVFPWVGWDGIAWVFLWFGSDGVAWVLSLVGLASVEPYKLTCYDHFFPTSPNM